MIDDCTQAVSPPLPSVRISLCGPMQMSWVDPATGEPLSIDDPTAGGRDRAAALSLFALLLCQPNRQAHRDWVMEQFWPEGSRSAAVHRLENIFSCLRKLLRPPGGEESLVCSSIGKKSSGPSYVLASYPRIWVDTDAIAWHVEQACRMERFGDDPLPFWERAFALLKRGPFLANDPYDPYAPWVKEQRERVQSTYRQCVHALSRLYRSHPGKTGQEEALRLLRTYWHEHQTDEDALRPLLELLGEQERYQEAEAYYQQLLGALAELESDEQGHPHVPDARTQDIREFLRTRQILRNRAQNNPISHSTRKQPSSAFRLSGEDHVSPILSEEISPSPFVAGFPFFSAQQHIIREDDKNVREKFPMDTLRRRLLQMGIGSAGAFLGSLSDEIFNHEQEIIERLAIALKKPSSVDEIFMNHLETTTRNNRKRFVLSKNSVEDMCSLQQDVSSHLLTITKLLEHSYSAHLHLCTLAGETAQLLGDISFYQGKNENASTYYEMALKVAEEAQNNALQAVILGRKCFFPLYNGDAEAALTDISHAHELAASNTSDHIRAWLLVIEAEAQALRGNVQICSQALQQSEFFLQRKHAGFSTSSFDVETQYAPVNTRRLVGYMGACYLRLGEAQKARPILQAYLASINATSLHQQSITLADLAKTSALQNEIEEMYMYASQALLILEQTRSARVMQRIINFRRELQRWQDTSYVKHIDQQIAAISTH